MLSCMDLYGLLETPGLIPGGSQLGVLESVMIKGHFWKPSQGYLITLIYTFLTCGPVGKTFPTVFLARELEEVPEASSVLLLSAHAPGYFQRPDVWPFLQQLRCYATQRGMRFETKSGPWPVQHETVAVIEVSWNLHQFWATRKPPGDCFLYFLSKKERKGRVLFSFSI